MQLPVLSGIYTDVTPDARQAYPVNMIPVPKETGVSHGYLRPADGIVANGEGPGFCRGGMEWDGELYRVMGTKFVRIAPDGVVTEIGDVGPGGQVTMDAGYDRMVLASGGRLYYYLNGVLEQVTDPVVGNVLDVQWINGYYMVTDGAVMRISDLNDPMTFPLLAYAAAEMSPDPIVALLRFRNEIYSVNRNTIEVFTQRPNDPNYPPPPDPFYRVDGAQVQKGAVATHACCVFNEVIAFLGSGFNESNAVYLSMNGSLERISTQDIDLLIMRWTDEELQDVVLETRNDKAHQLLYVHLPDRTVVYDMNASKKTGMHVWWQLTSALEGFSQYRARNLVWCYNRWNVADPTSAKIGYLDRSVSSHYGDHVRWEFSTLFIYNESKAAIINQIELVALTGAVNEYVHLNPGSLEPPVAGGPPVLPTIDTAYSLDGQSWSQPRSIKAGATGDTRKRLVWFRQGFWRGRRIQRFTGTTQVRIAPMAIEVQVEGMAY